MAKRTADIRLTRRVWRKPGLRRASLLVVVYAVLSVLLFLSLLPESVQLEVGQASPRYIGAPRTVEDQYTTEKLKEQARQSVKDIFEQDPNVPILTSDEVDEIFGLFLSVFEAAETAEERLELIRPQLSVDLPDDLVRLGLGLGSDANRQLAGMLNQLLGEAYARGIKAEALASSEEQLQRDIDRLYISEGQKSLLRQIGIQLLRPNMLYNALATDQLRQEAESRVLPVRVQKGQKIVGQGEIATEREIRLLEDLGLLRPALNWMLAAGSFAFMLVALLPIFFYLWLFRPDVWRDSKQLILIGLILLLTGIICRVSAALSGFMLPVAMASILIAVLIGPRLGAVASVSMALIATALSGFELATFGVSLAGGMAGAFGVSRMHQRFDLVRAGAVIAGIASLATVAFGLLLGTGWRELLGDVMGAAAGGVLSAILGFGVLPFLERPFGIASTIKLLELSNPTHPLLRRLLVEAPGTYNHSIIVANLAEAAAEAVGGNGLLARVGAYYHDVGKIKRPYFFIENQFMMENPHDKYPPSLSALVITSHVKDGVELVRENKLPEVLADIVQQHHGTTLVGYFFHKAKENCDVNEEDYRYPGPTPRTKEAAIIMLADSVEAAVRSLSQPTPGRIDSLVRKIIKERLNDGQLDECDITLRQLDQVGTAFVHILSGIFHKRIEYPEKLPDGEKVKVDDLDSK